MKNGIKLYCGRVIEGYPKQAISPEESGEILGIDTTGEYFGIGKKSNKPGKRINPEEKRLEKLFTDNAFLILANRERILSDSRLLLTPTVVDNHLAYSGRFPVATLGTYIEWWLNTPQSILFGENDEMSLIWYIAGSPLSGSNMCSQVYENGRTENIAVKSFIKLWPIFAKILANYAEAKRLYQAYTLPEAIDILKQETSEENYANSIKDFYHQAKLNLEDKEHRQD